MLGSLLSLPLLRLMRPAYVLGSCLTFAAAALIVMIHATGAHSLTLLVLGSVLLAIGTAPGTAIVADLVVSAAPQKRSGAASALNETTSEFGGALGIALLGSLATFIYRQELSRTIPAGTPADVMEVALRGIGAAGTLPQTTGSTLLLSSAQAAYTTAVSVAFLAGGAILLLAAGISVVTFRKATS